MLACATEAPTVAPATARLLMSPMIASNVPSGADGTASLVAPPAAAAETVAFMLELATAVVFSGADAGLMGIGAWYTLTVPATGGLTGAGASTGVVCVPVTAELSVSKKPTRYLICGGPYL